jgi:hypothetical protein
MHLDHLNYPYIRAHGAKGLLPSRPISAVVLGYLTFSMVCYLLLPGGALKYSSYLIPFIIFLCFLISPSSFRLDRFSISAIILYNICFLAALVTSTKNAGQFFIIRDFVIFNLVLSVTCVKFSISQRDVLILSTVTFLVIILRGVILGGGGESDISIADSYSPFESVFSGVYACIALIFLRQKKYKLSFMLCIFSIVAFKRNAWLAAMLCVCLMFVYELFLYRIKNEHRGIIIFFVNTLLFIVCIFASFQAASIFEYARDILSPEKEIWEFTLGRSEIYYNTDLILSTATVPEITFGHGPGYVKQLLETIISLGLPHNELRHFLVDYGALGVVVYFLSFIALASRSRDGYIVAYFSLFSGVIDNFYFVYLISLPCVLLTNRIGLSDYYARRIRSWE